LASLLCPSSGVVGYKAAAGFDLASGLGSLDVFNFAQALKSPPDFSASTPTTSLTLFTGESGSATITVAALHGFSGSVAFACSGLPSGTTCSFSPTSVSGSGTTTATIQTSGSANLSGTVVITAATGALSQVSHQAASIALSATAPFTMTPTATSFQVAQGSSVDATVNVTFASGFNQVVTFSCPETIAGSTCTPPAQGINASGMVSFHITTSAPTAKLQRPLDGSMKIFYAVLMPGLMGIVFVAGSRKRSLRGMRVLGLIIVLGGSTMWMASCGGNGSSGTTGNPGTPKGTYTINVTGTSSGPTTASTSFQLVVQ
jgi:hypothetical protein